MWYGLKVDGRILAVKWSCSEPDYCDFGVDIPKTSDVCLVVVRVREVSVVA